MTYFVTRATMNCPGLFRMGGGPAVRVLFGSRQTQTRQSLLIRPPVASFAGGDRGPPIPRPKIKPLTPLQKLMRIKHMAEQELELTGYKEKMDVTRVPYLKMNSGRSIPMLGLGTWKAKPGEVSQIVKHAIDIGYRHIDCARIYLNETEVGEGIARKIYEGKVTREELFVTSKLWNTFHSPDLVVPALKRSLHDLKLTYVDLYLIHWPMGYQEKGELFPKDTQDKIIYSDVDYVDTWTAMETCVSLGLARSIGVSNFNSKQIDRIWENAAIKPAVNQIEVHPYLNQKKLIAYCKDKGMVVTGYSPFGSPDRPWAKPDDPKLLEDEKLVRLGNEYGMTPAQIVLKWVISRGVVTIPKTVTRDRLLENGTLWDFELSEHDINIINKFDVNGRACHAAWHSDHPHFPFKEEF